MANTRQQGDETMSALTNRLNEMSNGRLMNARPFTCYDDREFESMVLNSKEFVTHGGDVPTCDNCSCLMAKFDLQFVCETCGCEEDILGDDTDAAAEYYARGGTNGNNTTSNSSAPLRICGPGSHMLQKKMIGSVSNYKVQQRKNTIEEMVNTVYQYDGAKIPDNVVLEAAELYYAVQQCAIHRADVKRGAQAACLYRRCIKNGITRKPKEIADIFNIPQENLSLGEKILDKLIAEGQLDIDATQMYFNADTEIESFSDRYFEDLDMPTTGPVAAEFKSFVKQIIKFTFDKHIADSSIPSSKCAGAIYILTLKRDDLHIRWNDIQTKCKISKSTFTRFAKAVLDAAVASCDKPEKTREHYKKCSVCRTGRQIQHIFKSHNVPL